MFFEPETWWLSIDVPPCNRDKLLAAQTLAYHPSFFSDVRVFANTVLALNHSIVEPSTIPECTPEQMAWACLESELLFNIAPGGPAEPVYDDEVTAYVATMLLHHGQVVTPPELDFADDVLEGLLRSEGQALRAKMKAGSSDSDPTLIVQREHLQRAEHYVDHRLNALVAELSA